MIFSVFSDLEKDYGNLYNLALEIEENIFTSPHSSIVKSRTFLEGLTKEIFKLDRISDVGFMTQAERQKELFRQGVINREIEDAFNIVRMLGNQAAHGTIPEELEVALRVHKNIYKITCWFIEAYVNYDFEATQYKSPKPQQNVQPGNEEVKSGVLSKLLHKVEDLISMAGSVGNSNNLPETKENQHNENTIPNNIEGNDEIASDSTSKTEETKVIEEKDKKCLIQELSKLKESSREAVEGVNTFSEFKTYMHVPRDAQEELEGLIMAANKANGAQLILVCGSVGDGKSHIISYFNNKYPQIMENFTLYNDATESLEPEKTSMDTLNDVLDNFSDDKIDTSNEKFILAINLGTLNNFIDSEYRERYTKLHDFVAKKKILESTIEEDKFDDDSNFQYINFSDFHLFTLKDGRVKSDYIKSLIGKLTTKSELNKFYESYKKNCSQCQNCDCCPIKANYELISKEEVQDSIVDLLVQGIIKNKIIISTRALLNFLYEIVVARSYVDVNSPMFKQNIGKLTKENYIRSLTPNILFNHRELSFIFDALSTLDPLNVRNSKVDDFVLEFNNSNEIDRYFDEYIDFSKGYMDKVRGIDIENIAKKEEMRLELVKLFIRSYYLCGKGELFSLKDNVYESYISNVYYWNRGEKSKLKTLYTEIKDGIVKWNGETDKDCINIFIGKNQIKYKVSEELEIKGDLSGLPTSIGNDSEIKKFLTTVKLKYKKEKDDKSYDIEIDYPLYELLQKVIHGYRPNKKDKNHFIKFIEFVNRLEDLGSRNEKLIFTEKNRQENKKYKLEYDNEFDEYRFVEM